MNIETIVRVGIDPGLALLGEKYDSTEARRMLIAIALQESNLTYRRQIRGPARGFWQFETGGVRGVMNHRSSVIALKSLCERLEYEFATQSIHDALEHNDVLACAVARLLLWTDSAPLPKNESDGWAYYLRNWRPGKPHPDRWGACWSAAESAANLRLSQPVERSVSTKKGSDK